MKEFTSNLAARWIKLVNIYPVLRKTTTFRRMRVRKSLFFSSGALFNRQHNLLLWFKNLQEAVFSHIAGKFCQIRLKYRRRLGSRRSFSSLESLAVPFRGLGHVAVIDLAAVSDEFFCFF